MTHVDPKVRTFYKLLWNPPTNNRISLSVIISNIFVYQSVINSRMVTWKNKRNNSTADEAKGKKRQKILNIKFFCIVDTADASWMSLIYAPGDGFEGRVEELVRCGVNVFNGLWFPVSDSKVVFFWSGNVIRSPHQKKKTFESETRNNEPLYTY